MENLMVGQRVSSSVVKLADDLVSREVESWVDI